MKRRENLTMAVIGTRDQAALLRLAGVQKYRVIDEGQNTAESVLHALETFLGDGSVAVIVLPEVWAEHVQDIIRSRREKKQYSPVIITVPSGYRAAAMDVKAFYKAYTKQLVGFNIEI
jgi:vacuolar-type H+-ATPase subunit F/Vma7